MKKFKNIFLHVGPRKTGSSAIQQFFHANRKALESIDFYYPNGLWQGQLGSVFSTNALAYIYNISHGKDDPLIIKSEDDSYFRKFKTELSKTKANNLVLSYEGFIDLDVNSLKNFASYKLFILNIRYCLCYHLLSPSAIVLKK